MHEPPIHERRADGDPPPRRSGSVDPFESLRRVQDVLGRKWHSLIVYRLFTEGAMGFVDLKDGLAGVSSKVLSESLDDLERRGLVDRELLDDRPVRVSYSLTDGGAALGSLLGEAIDWERDHRGPATDGDR